MSNSLPSIVLLGRPNVGKSTLFNRLIHSKRAITHDLPGITRDRMEGIIRRQGQSDYGIIDTGGLTLGTYSSVVNVSGNSEQFEKFIFDQATVAIETSVAIALVVDGRAGLLPLDEHLASYARKFNKPMLLIVNKVDGLEHEETILAEFHALGLPVIAVSAEHGHNLRYLEETLSELIPDFDILDIPKIETTLKIAIIGKPNAGKSSIINAILGQPRMIVSDVAGTTRDSVDVKFEQDGDFFVFVDTAGIRRRSKIVDSIERYSVNSAIKSTTKADVTVIVVDASLGISQQDKRLIDLLNDRKTPFMVMVSKTDLIQQRVLKELKEDIKEILQFCKHIPIIYSSSTKKQGIKKILPLAMQIHEECKVRITTGKLNRAMESVLEKHQCPVINRVRAKFFYLTQAETVPPTFVFFVNDAERVPENYIRYIERSLRNLFSIVHAPLRIKMRSSHGKKNK